MSNLSISAELVFPILSTIAAMLATVFVLRMENRQDKKLNEFLEKLDKRFVGEETCKLRMELAQASTCNYPRPNKPLESKL